MRDGGFHCPLVHKVRAMKYVHSFKEVLYKCMVTVAEYLLFTESDQDFLVTSPYLGNCLRGGRGWQFDLSSEC